MVKNDRQAKQLILLNTFLHCHQLAGGSSHHQVELAGASGNPQVGVPFAKHPDRGDTDRAFYGSDDGRVPCIAAVDTTLNKNRQSL